MQKIKRDDDVIVIAGKVGDDSRMLISGVNIVKRHTKANPMAGSQGGIVEKEAPIHVSNVAIFNPETSKADRIGFKVEDGKKVRIFKSTQKAVDA